ncbi:hypothetical protein [Jatrophihabitans lederbergiae]
MHTRTLGTGEHALQVSAIGYGCMGLSQSYLPIPTRGGCCSMRVAMPVSSSGLGELVYGEGVSSAAA